MQPLLVNGAPFEPHEPQDGILADLAAFLKEWESATPTMCLQTSGSTGTPKCIEATKAAMRASAEATCRFFGLQRGDKALLCLPMRYIAGKMMVVRALAYGLELVTPPPSSTPLATLQTTVKFAPLVPMQAHTTLQQPDGMAQLEKADIILLGGGFIDAALEDALQDCSSAVYASYGMTETLSHIALRRVNGAQRTACYTPLPGVAIRLSSRGTLAVSAPSLGIEYLETNDIAEIHPDGTFRILGRVDNVINSGGIKIQAESIEQAIITATGITCVVVPLPHPVLGQAVGLVWEGNEALQPALMQAIDTLPKYHKPRRIIHAAIPRTPTGKPDRAKTKATALEL